MNIRNITAWGGLLAVAGSIFHLVVTGLFRGDAWSQVVDDGALNAVSLNPTAAELPVAEAFWIGPGSFAAPFGLLGLYVLAQVRRGQRVPAWLGWGVIAWASVVAILMPPSGAWLILAVGVLLVLGDRRHARTTAAT